MKYIFSTGLLFISVTVASQPHLPGLAFPTYGAGEWRPAISTNPAHWGRSDRSNVSVNAGKTFMLVPQLSVSAGVPTKGGAFGIGLHYKGGQLHTGTEATIAYGRKLAQNISVGLGFGYVRSRIPGYISEGEGRACGGLLLRLTPELVTGMDIRKRVTLSGKEKLETEMYHAGIGYTVSELLLIVAEIEKEEGHPAVLSTGLEYSFRKELYASIGFAASVGTWFFGSGAKFSSCTIESVFSFHPALGLTPSITLIFQKRKKQK